MYGPWQFTVLPWERERGRDDGRISGSRSISGVTLANLVFWVVATILLIPVGIVCVEILAALLPRRRIRVDAAVPRPRVGVLIPAHNEASVIVATLESVRPQLLPGDRLLVVADNCTDETAALARANGAEVVERSDDVRRGKGYALDFGVQALGSDSPPVVILLDADVTVTPNAIENLARQALATRSPAQGVYVLREAPAADGHDVVSHLAFVVRNQVRPLGLARLGGPCPLFGAGMAFPWEIISTAPLATGNIVEDMALGLDLAANGRAPLLCTEASIDGTLPRARSAASNQRRRWEHGHLRTIFTRVPITFFIGLLKLRPHAAMLAADLFVPPLSFQVLMMLFASGVFLGSAWLLGTSSVPGFVLLGGTLLLIALLLLAWMRFSSHGWDIRPLFAVPGYILRKIPMYFSFFAKSEKEWKRTDRSDNSAAPSTKH